MSRYRSFFILPFFLSSFLLLLAPSQAQSVNATNLLKMSRSYAAQNDWKKAKEYAEKAIKEEAGFVDAVYMRAFCYQQLGELDKAISDFKDVIRVDPHFLPTYGALAEIYLEQKKFPEADALFAQLSKQPDGAKWASYYQGVVAYLQADLPKAEKFWKEVLAQDINFAPAHHNLGALYLAQGNSSKALANFREALEKKPETAMYRFHIAWALERLGQIPAAQAMLKTVMDENSDDEKVWLLARGLDRLTRNQAQTAVEVLKTVAENHPENLDVWVLLGRANLALNAPEVARKALDTAKKIDPAFQEVDLLLSKLPAPSSTKSVEPES